jgi:hypothetical protein
VVRYSFPVRLFHSLLHAGLSRRSDSPHVSVNKGIRFAKQLWITRAVPTIPPLGETVPYGIM